MTNEEKEIQQKVWNEIKKIEYHNFRNKKFSNDDMVAKIRKIIEENTKK